MPPTSKSLFLGVRGLHPAGLREHNRRKCARRASSASASATTPPSHALLPDLQQPPAPRGALLHGTPPAARRADAAPVLPQNEEHMRFFCRTCPYVFQLKSKVTSEATLERKVVDDVLGGPDAWKNADQTEGARALPATSTSCLPPPPCTSQAPSACLGPTLGSQLRQVRQRPRVLPAAADPLGRRADDHLLQVHRLRHAVARGLTRFPIRRRRRGAWTARAYRWLKAHARAHGPAVV